MTTQTVFLNTGDDYIECEITFDYFPAERQTFETQGLDEEYELNSLTCCDWDVSEWLEGDDIYNSIITQLKNIRQELNYENITA